MDKQAQDKLWNDLSEEQRAEYSKEFQQETKKYSTNIKHCDIENDFEYCTGYSNGIITTLEELFGEHNLNPKPQIKTWEDVPLRGEKLDIELYDQMCNIAVNRFEINDKIIDKAIATFRIYWLIELGYGGMMTEEEWKDTNGIEKFCVVWVGGTWGYMETYDYKQFIAFHTPEQRVEFMSYPENRKLVEQYHML